MQEQMGQPIDEEKIPPTMDDFPEEVNIAMDIFNRMGDRVFPDIGYIGKDFTNLNLYLDIYGVDKQTEKDFILEIIEWLDARAIKKSSEQLKREYDKMKRKK